MNTVLGKITNVRFGFVSDYPFLFGIDFDFSFGDCSGVSSGGKYTVNISISKNYKWSSEKRKEAIESLIDFITKILKDAKVDNVYDLKNKPVEIYLQDNTFVNFRILTEVL